MKHHRPFTFALSLFVLAVGLAPARAEESLTAAEHASQAQAAYDVQDWATAVREYRAAYLLDRKPEYLWAIAQTLRMSEDFSGAIKAYQAYRRSEGVSAAQANAAEMMITKCEAEVAKREAAEAEKRKKETPTPAPSARTKPSPEPAPRSGLSPVWFTVGAVVTVGLGAATVWSGLDVLSKNSDYEKAPTRTAFDDGRDRELRTNVLMIATGVTFATTAVVGVFFTNWSGQREPHPAPVAVGVAPAPGGATFALGGTF
jgi:hypothetical protein